MRVRWTCCVLRSTQALSSLATISALLASRLLCAKLVELADEHQALRVLWRACRERAVPAVEAGVELVLPLREVYVHLRLVARFHGCAGVRLGFGTVLRRASRFCARLYCFATCVTVTSKTP